MKKLAGLILMLAMVGRAATVTGPIYDSSSNAVNTVVTFVPKSTPQVIGPSLILDVQRTVKPTNGNFSIFLVGGFYDSQYGTYSKPLRILVPPNDTNTYTIGFCANLASNAATFTWTNFTGRISERVLPGTNVVFQTNHAGAANESLTVSSAGGDTWTNDHSSGTAYLLSNVPLQVGDIRDLFSGNSSANVNSRLLNDTTGNPAEDWGVRTLIAGDGTTSVNWASRLLADTSSLTAIDWSNRRMKNASGTTLLDWSGASLNGTNSTFSGLIAVTNGTASYARNLLAPIAITVGASPFNWTNSSASAGGGTNGVVVYVDGVSVTGTVGINGTTVFNTIGQNTILLGPQEWTTITYTIGTPTASFKNR